MNEEDIRLVFNQVRREYRFPPADFVIDKEGGFFIENGLVHLNIDMIQDKIHLRSILRHEIGHMHYEPVTLQRHKRYLEIVREELKKKVIPLADNLEIVQSICNICYDCVVDKKIKEELHDNLEYRLRCDLKTIEKKEKARGNDNVYPSHPFWWILMQYYNRVCEKELVKVEGEFAFLGNKLYDIISSRRPFENKIKEIARLLANQDFMKDAAEFARFIQWLEKTLGKRLRRIITKEMLKKDSSEIKRELEDCIDLNDDKKTVFGLAKAMNVKLEGYEYYKMLARKRIKFKLLSKSEKKGKIIKGGLEVWRIDDEVEDLETEESLREYGILIPEMTTLKFEKKYGFDGISRDIPKIILILDTSGSMNIRDGLVTCFSLIEACRYYNNPVSIILFSDSAYFVTNFSKEYERLERDIYSKYLVGGTDLYPAVEEAERILKNQKGCLVLVISDFVTNNFNPSMQKLSEINEQNSVVLLSLNKDVNFPGLKVYRINSIKDLNNLVISNINEYNR